MLYFDGLFGLIMLGLWLYCIIDVITTDGARCRNLPKLAWLFIVLLLPEVGSIAWLVAGHPWPGSAAGGPPRRAGTGRHPEYERPGRRVAANPDDDEEFLRGLRERAEQQRQEYQDRQERERLAELERQRLERQRWEQRGQDEV
ncbi:MAG: PLDc N-terminal domain-containing protein [Jatrophihabitantaceae bacterium]